MIGFKVQSAAGGVSVSSDTFNMTFAGMALPQGSGTGVTAYIAEVYGRAVGGPVLNWYDFYIDVPDGSPVVPFFQCAGWCALKWITRSHTVPNRWVMGFVGTAAPAVYCFAKLPTATPIAGYGIVVRDENSNPCYFSGARHLLPRAVFQSQNTNCDPVGFKFESTTMVRPSHGAVSQSVETSVTNQMLYAPAVNSAVMTNSENTYVFEVVYLNNGFTLQTMWGLASSFSGASVPYSNAGSQNLVVIGSANEF